MIAATTTTATTTTATTTTASDAAALIMLNFFETTTLTYANLFEWNLHPKFTMPNIIINYIYFNLEHFKTIFPL